jgi:hypothetical protein
MADEDENEGLEPIETSTSEYGDESDEGLIAIPIEPEERGADSGDSERR